MNIKDYQTVTELKPSDIFILNGVNGTKTITADSLATALNGLLNSRNRANISIENGTD